MTATNTGTVLYSISRVPTTVVLNQGVREQSADAELTIVECSLYSPYHSREVLRVGGQSTLTARRAAVGQALRRHR